MIDWLLTPAQEGCGSTTEPLNIKVFYKRLHILFTYLSLYSCLTWNWKGKQCPGSRSALSGESYKVWGGSLSYFINTYLKLNMFTIKLSISISQPLPFQGFFIFTRGNTTHTHQCAQGKNSGLVLNPPFILHSLSINKICQLFFQNMQNPPSVHISPSESQHHHPLFGYQQPLLIWSPGF